MLERSMRSKEDFEEKRNGLKAKVRQAGDEEMGYDDLITDLTELFLSGEDIPRNPESVGSSSKSITTLFWNLGNWNRGVNFRVPAELDYTKLFYKETNQERYPDHVREDNNLFMKMVKNFRGHIILNCEASSLLTHKEYIEKNGWKMCFNDATDLCCLARLGVDGSIRQIAGPNEDSSEAVWNGPKRRVSFAIFEITWGKAIPRGAFSVSTSGYFLVMTLKTMKKWLVPECRPLEFVFIMLTMIALVKPIRSLESALRTCFTSVSYIKLQLLLVMQTSWHIKSREFSWTVPMVCLHFSFGLTDLSRPLMHIWRRLFLVSAEI